MRDMLRFLGYGISSLAVIFLLIYVSSSESGAGGGGLLLALFLVVVVPVVLGIALVNRAKRKEAAQERR
ncbi:MAG: hypothetical protein OEW58_02395 [Gammaproteobacteria bacterium]|nr:hypothetical protein [Gammaproteobacteria bacterium]